VGLISSLHRKICNPKSQNQYRSLDQRSRPGEHLRRNRHADLLCRLEIDHQLELRRLFHWYVGGFGAESCSCKLNLFFLSALRGDLFFFGLRRSHASSFVWIVLHRKAGRAAIRSNAISRATAPDQPVRDSRTPSPAARRDRRDRVDSRPTQWTQNHDCQNGSSAIPEVDR
jgi:hypothetical protein